MKELIIATHNKGKLEEFRRIFEPFGLDIRSLWDYPHLAEVEETGTTFEENARLKAETIAKLLNKPVLADDSGLVVPALNGAPGIYSARYAGEPTNDQANIDLLMANMLGKSGKEREAYFVACLVLAHPEKESLVFEGRCYGEIAVEQSQNDGFGYNPIFYVPEKGKTFADMTMDEKNSLSHRSRAVEKLVDELPKWVG